MLAVCHQVRKQGILIDQSSEERPVFVQGQDTIIGQISSNNKDRLGGNTGFVYLFTRCDFIEIDESQLGDNIEQSILLSDDQRDWEVSRG